MAVSIREQCLAALFTRLSAIGGIEGLSVERNRDTPVTAFPTLVQRDMPGGARLLHEAVGVVFKAIDLQVEGFVQSDQAEDLAAAVDALHSAVLTAIAADVTLGGVAFDCRADELDLDQPEGAETPTAEFVIPIVLEFQHAERDPAAAV